MSHISVDPSRKDVWKMFDQISQTYDKVNRILSLGIDKRWRKKLASLLPEKNELQLLDLATGTADQILSLMDSTSNIKEAVGIDLSNEMLKIGQGKVNSRNYSKNIKLEQASATKIPFGENTFDCATMSFGVRNVDCVNTCLSEIHRVLRSGGRALILEFSLPKNPLIRLSHLFYLRRVLPKIGGFISKNKSAYTYLNQTIESFPSGESFCKLMDRAGFVDVEAHPLTFGVATIYQGDKL